MTDKEKEDKLTEFERIPKNYDMLEGYVRPLRFFVVLL